MRATLKAYMFAVGASGKVVLFNPSQSHWRKSSPQSILSARIKKLIHS